MSPTVARPRSHFEEDVLADAARVQDDIRTELRGAIGHEAAIVAAAPAGAGKTFFIANTIGMLREDDDLRVAAVTPTNEQAHNLIAEFKEQYANAPVSFVHANGRDLPAPLAALPGVTQPSVRDARDRGDRLVVATIDKLADAHLRDGLGGFDVLVMDEAYQADAARYYTAAATSPTHLLVGDAGQLDPFSSLDDATFWRGGSEDPLQTAVGVLLRNHPDTPVHRLPVTRRLDPRAAPIARSFYPGHHFDAAVRPGVREVRLAPGGPGRRRLATVDRALDEAAASGWAHLTLPGAPVLTADPATADLIVEVVRRIFERGTETRCENTRRNRRLRDDDYFVGLTHRGVAVGVSHNDQKDLLRALFDDAGLTNVTVDTANRLQGLTFEMTIAWHPLAGAAMTDAFHLDPGRLCVLLTRHRHACIVVGRDTDRGLLEAVPPATPGYLGWDPDPVLDGWDAHEAVFQHLEPHVVHA